MIQLFNVGFHRRGKQKKNMSIIIIGLLAVKLKYYNKKTRIQNFYIGFYRKGKKNKKMSITVICLEAS